MSGRACDKERENSDENDSTNQSKIRNLTDLSNSHIADCRSEFVSQHEVVGYVQEDVLQFISNLLNPHMLLLKVLSHLDSFRPLGIPTVAESGFLKRNNLVGNENNVRDLRNRSRPTLTATFLVAIYNGEQVILITKTPKLIECRDGFFAPISRTKAKKTCGELFQW